MLGQKVDYNIIVDEGKSKTGTVISFYTGLFISITEFGTLVFHNGANQKIIYGKKIEQEQPVNVQQILLETALENLGQETKSSEEVFQELKEQVLEAPKEKIEIEQVQKIGQEAEEKIEQPQEVKQETEPKKTVKNPASSRRKK